MKKFFKIFAVSLLVVSVAIGMSSCMKEIPIDNDNINNEGQTKKILPAEGMTTREFVEAVYAETEALFDAGEPFSIDLSHINEELRFDVEIGINHVLKSNSGERTIDEVVSDKKQSLERTVNQDLNSEEIAAILSQLRKYLETASSVLKYDFSFSEDGYTRKNPVLTVIPAALEEVKGDPDVYDSVKRDCIFAVFAAKICSEYEEYCQYDLRFRDPKIMTRNVMYIRQIRVNSSGEELDNAFIHVSYGILKYYEQSYES